MRVLLTGAGGQVGQAVRALAPQGANVNALTHAELDITDPHRVQQVIAAEHPQWIVNAAAFTAVDAAENARAATQLFECDRRGLSGPSGDGCWCTPRAAVD